jgi:tetratricopeptide (TPR) repeat protein
MRAQATAGACARIPDVRSTFALLLAGCTAGVPLPPRAVALNNAGIEALAAGDLEGADAQLSLALEYSPTFVDALVNLGLVELQRGNFERARTLFTRARRLNPDVAQPHHALGVLAERTGRPDQASAHYYEALRVDPGFSPARANLCRLLFAAGLLDEALVQYRRLLATTPADSAARAGMIETLERLGRHTEAGTELSRALAADPGSRELRLLEGRSLLRRGQVEQALERLVSLAERSDELGARALAFAGAAELARGNVARAAGAARAALAVSPDDAVAIYVLALALERAGSPDAAPWLERARAILPRDPLLEGLRR